MERTALVTGASRGIGKEIRTLFEANGIQVIAPQRAELDLDSSESITAYLKNLDGDIDILVNNAGINFLAECTDLDNAVLDQMIRVNLLAPMKLIRGIAPRMKAKRRGWIVNTSSIWSAVSKNGRIAYSAAKGGLNSMIHGAAVELAPYNILVNNIAPGFVNTELTRQNNNPQQIKEIEAQIPLGRLASTREIAELVSFLTSEKNTYITGQTIFIDGGYTCQ